MRIIKISLAIICLICLMLSGLMYYLLQPSGDLKDFQHYEAKPAQVASNTSALTVRFFSVSTLLFDNGKDQILIDGFFSRPNIWQVLGTKITANEQLLRQLNRQYQLQRTRAILVTHSHYDHALDIATLAEILPNSRIVGSESSLRIATSNPKIKPSQLQALKAWQPMTFGRFTVTAIPSQHTPPTAVNNDLGQQISHSFQMPARFSEFKEGGSFDYLIHHQGQNIFVKASTGFIPNQLKNLQVDTLFLGIAQLSKQSAEYQQQYLKETLGSLNPKTVIPIHWDDFFQPLQATLTFLPRIADDAPRSLNILLEAAQQQGAKAILLSKPVPYVLTSQAPKSTLR